MIRTRSTTILSVRKENRVAMAGDGQVTIGETIAKADAVKVRVLDDLGADGAGVLVGFAGSAADAFALLERFEATLKDSPANLVRAAIELAKQWRTDRVLRRLESLLVVADRAATLTISVRPRLEPGRIEEEITAELELTPEVFGRLPHATNQGGRRPLRVPLWEPEVIAEAEGLRLRFGLPKGSYATSVLREILADAPWFGEGGDPRPPTPVSPS